MDASRYGNFPASPKGYWYFSTGPALRRVNRKGIDIEAAGPGSGIWRTITYGYDGALHALIHEDTPVSWEQAKAIAAQWGNGVVVD